MSEKPLPFVVTDRRKFTTEGEARLDADPSPEREPRPETVATPAPAEPAPELSSFAEGGGPAFAIAFAVASFAVIPEGDLRLSLTPTIK